MTHEPNTATDKDASFNAGLGDESFDQLVGKMLAGAQTLLQENGRRAGEIILNDFLPPNVQADVLLERPQMASHSAALQQAVDEHVKPGMTVRLFGNFKMSKLAGYRPDIYGRDNQPVPGQPLLTRHGAQPCLMLRADNNIYDFSNCVFTVDKLFQDGVHIAGYQGDCRAEHMGHWFTAAILAVDPNKLSASNWKGALGSKGRGNDWLAPIDNNTGFAFKGYPNAGFNTANYSAYDMAHHHNNSLDTSKMVSGGYGGLFPQSNGSTAPTWGTWRGGWIGNAGSAMVVYQLPEVAGWMRKIASFRCMGIYGRGFITGCVSVGLLGKPDGSKLERIDAAAEPYVPRNVYLYHTVAEDMYSAGVQLNRYIDLWEIGTRAWRIGHPDWSLEHSKPGETEVLVDPGYGTASGRFSPQIRRRIMMCSYVDCARKGIDAHHGTDTIVDKCYVKAGVWGMQVALEENLTDIHEDSTFGLHMVRYVIRDCEFHAGLRALDFINGAYSWLTHKEAVTNVQLWGLRVDVAVENTLLAAPFGWRDNYGRGGFRLNNVTAVFDAPYGIRNGFNTSLFRGFWIGSGNVARNGMPLDYSLNNCKVANSPVGNYATGLFIEAVNVLNMWNVIVDTTPYTTDAANQGKLAFTGSRPVIRSGHETRAFNLTVEPAHADIMACYTSNMRTGKSVKFEYPKKEEEDDGAGVISIPIKAQAEIRFDFLRATDTRIVDTHKIVPIQYQDSTTRPPDNTSPLTHTDTSPRYIDARLQSAGASTGIYPIVRGVYMEARTTVVIPVKIESFGARTFGYVFAATKEDNTAGMGWLIARNAVDDAAKFTLSASEGVLVNGQTITADSRFNKGEWMIVSWTNPLIARDLALLGRYDGNGVTQGKIGEGLVIYPNRVLDNNALQAKIFELRALYNIQ